MKKELSGFTVTKHNVKKIKNKEVPDLFAYKTP